MGAESQKKPGPLAREFNPSSWELFLIDVEELVKSITSNDQQLKNQLIEYYLNEIENKKELLAGFLCNIDQNKLLFNYEKIRNSIKNIYLRCSRISRKLLLLKNKLILVNDYQINVSFKELNQQIQELEDAIHSSQSVCKSKNDENANKSTSQTSGVVKNIESEVVTQKNQESANKAVSTPTELTKDARRINLRRNPQKKPIRQQSVSRNDNQIEVSQKITKTQNSHITGKQEHDVPTKKSRSGHHNETSSRKNKRQIHPQGLLVDKQKIRKKKKFARRYHLINTYTRRLPRVRKRLLSSVAMSRNKSLNLELSPEPT